jgi:hypothetical protein
MNEFTKRLDPALSPPMAITVTTSGVTAFAGERLAMNDGNPTIEHFSPVKDLEDWTTTLEEVIAMPSCKAHRWHLESMYFAFKAVLKKHEEQHLEVVTEAPTAEDLQAYLSAYAAALAGTAPK